ncbi:uncharacterized protein LOC142353687 isoform X4 [Convolutriloba macropyga]|uniref:uncharacterized protein LOC142353687 isoform X4 n=1 Tax=Convolutriloba macropyga TaxID=536237 RepID=UPI003F51D0A9
MDQVTDQDPQVGGVDIRVVSTDTTTDLTADHMDRPRPKEVGTSPPQLPGPESTTHPKNGEQE